MQNKSNKIGAISWTVHTESGFDALKARKLWATVYDPVKGTDDPEYEKWVAFVEVFVQSTDVHVPFEWPEFTTDIQKLRATRDSWLALPAKIFRLWKADISEVDKAIGDEDLLPPEMLPKADATIPPSQANEPTSAVG